MNRLLSFVAGLVLLSLVTGCGTAPVYRVTVRPESPLPVPLRCRIGPMLDSLPATFSPEQKPTFVEITAFRLSLLDHLTEKEKIAAAPLEDTSASRYTIVGIIRDFKRGNIAARFFIGFGAGEARLVCALRLIDNRTQRVVFSGEYSDLVWSASRDDKSAFNEIAGDFANSLDREVGRH